jgi:hypothetical protein
MVLFFRSSKFMFHAFANIFFKISALLFCLLICNNSFSQTDSLASEKSNFFGDTIKLPYKLISKKDTVFSRTDTIILIREMIVQEKKMLVQVETKTNYMGMEVIEMKDSIVTVSDTIVTKVDTVLTKNEKVLQDIEAFSKKKNIFSRLLREILVFDKKEPPPPAPLQQTIPASSIKPSAQPYEGFNEKIIRNIDIRVLDVFGPTISNQNRMPKNLLQKGANFIHIKSQRWLIRNKLLFERGERVNSLKISESERLLRQSNYIYDARISVVEIKGSDSVDIYVIAQDVWSINAGIGVGGTSFGGDFREVNFLGLGQQVESSATYDPKLPGGYNYSGKYTINNLYKTLITANFFYIYLNGQRMVGYGLNRDFITPAIKFAGGFNMSFNKTPIYTMMGDSTIKIEPLNYNIEDLWLGYAAKFNQHARSAKYKGNRMIFSGRVTRSDYLERPAIVDSVKYNYTYYNTYFYLGSIGFINRRFYKDNYIFRFGRTEDIAEGYMLAFTSGIQKREIGSRPYFGVAAAWSKFNSKYGYIFGGAGIGGFYDANQWHEGVVYNKYLYFTPLISLGNWRNRNFLGIRYSHGYNLIPGITTNINRDNGVRGFRSDKLTGDQKVVINSEVNLFPPLNIVGFRMAFVVFADFAWVSIKGKLIDKENFFPGYGVGIRFGNDHWIFGTFQFLLGYYPHAKWVDKPSYLGFNSPKFFYNYNDFQFSRPEVIPF